MLWGPGPQAIYIFEQDEPGRSRCYGECAAAWPPVFAEGKPVAGKGVREGLLGTVERRGKRQVTYNGHPLYTFTGDTGSGQTNGQGLNAFGARWYVVDTSGNRITRPPQSSVPGY